jgi:hypothetical protein
MPRASVFFARFQRFTMWKEFAGGEIVGAGHKYQHSNMEEIVSYCDIYHLID